MIPQIFELAPLAQTSILSFIILLLGLSGLLFMLWLKQMPIVTKFASLGLLLTMLGGFSWVFYQSSQTQLVLTDTELTLDPTFRT